MPPPAILARFDFNCLPSASHLRAWLLSALLRSTCVRAPCLRSRSSAPSFFSLSGDFLSLQRCRRLSMYLHRSDRLYRLFWIYWLLCASPRSTRSRKFLINFFSSDPSARRHRPRLAPLPLDSGASHAPIGGSIQQSYCTQSYHALSSVILRLLGSINKHKPRHATGMTYNQLTHTVGGVNYDLRFYTHLLGFGSFWTATLCIVK